MESHIAHHAHGSGELDRANAIASALRRYSRSGISASPYFTPKAMLQAASEITGLKFRSRDYVKAADALTKWADEHQVTHVVEWEGRPCTSHHGHKFDDGRCNYCGEKE